MDLSLPKPRVSHVPKIDVALELEAMKQNLLQDLSVSSELSNGSETSKTKNPNDKIQNTTVPARLKDPLPKPVTKAIFWMDAVSPAEVEANPLPGTLK